MVFFILIIIFTVLRIFTDNGEIVSELNWKAIHVKENGELCMQEIQDTDAQKWEVIYIN